MRATFYLKIYNFIQFFFKNFKTLIKMERICENKHFTDDLASEILNFSKDINLIRM